jgi:hypothetical protein
VVGCILLQDFEGESVSDNVVLPTVDGKNMLSFTGQEARLAGRVREMENKTSFYVTNLASLRVTYLQLCEPPITHQHRTLYSLPMIIQVIALI